MSIIKKNNKSNKQSICPINLGVRILDQVTTIEKLKKINVNKKKTRTNIQKKTLESEDFYILVKKKIEKANKIIIRTNQ